MGTMNATQLYNYLKGRSNTFTKLWQIHNDFYGWYDRDFHDSIGRKEITKLIRSINESEEFEKIIISTPNGVKIASEDEFWDYLGKEYASIFRRLKRANIKARKAQRNKQVRFIGTDIDEAVIDSFSELNFHPAIIEEAMKEGIPLDDQTLDAWITDQVCRKCEAYDCCFNNRWNCPVVVERIEEV